jgi:ABC-2 type transport system permease protein
VRHDETRLVGSDDRLGVATAVRDSPTAIGVVLGLLYLFPILAGIVSDPAWHRHLEQIGPMTADSSIEATTGLSSLPISPSAGLGALAAWRWGRWWSGGWRFAFGMREAPVGRQ